MESGSGGSLRKDPAWKYAHLTDPSNTNDFECNFCGKVTKGGVYRVKQHLLGGFRAAKACPKCPLGVKEEIRDYMARKAAGGAKGNDGDALPTFDFGDGTGNLFEDGTEDEVLINYVTRSKRGGAACGGSGRAFQCVPEKEKQKGLGGLCEDGEVGKLRRIKETAIYKAFKKALRERACRDIARWMYDAGIPFNAVNVKSFAFAVQSIGRYGPGMKPPSYHEIRNLSRRKGGDHTKETMKAHKKQRSSEFHHLPRKMENIRAPCFNDLAFVKYNRTLKHPRDGDDELDPIRPDDIDDSDEYLVEDFRPFRAIEATHRIRSRTSMNISSRRRSLMYLTRASKATRTRFINEKEASLEDSEKTDVEEEEIEGNNFKKWEDDDNVDD